MSYIYDLTDTWNAGGTTFTAVKMNVTDTASAAGSALFDLQVGGVSQFKVSKAGAASAPELILTGAIGVAAPAGIHRSTDADRLIIAGGDTTVGGGTAGSRVVLFGDAHASTPSVTFYDATTHIFRDSAGSATATMTLNSVAIPTISSTDTLSNKTLSSPTVSGTISGAAAFASTVTVANNVSFRVTGTGADVRNAVKMTTADTIEFATTNNNVTLSGFTLAFITVAGTVLSADNVGLITVRDASDIAVGTTTGTKIGTATTQKLVFFNATPVVQPTAVADATDAASVITQLNALLTRMRNLGLIAT